jgi:hypothetical protein
MTMRYFYDKELQGHAMVFDGPIDLVESATKATDAADCPNRFKEGVGGTSHPGRPAKGKPLREMLQFLKTPWKEAMDRVDYVQAEVKKVSMPTPVDMRRRPRWSETDGEVDVDRALNGDPDLYREIKRQRRVGPTHIALVTNLDAPYSCNESGLFYRSTACIAATDILEDLGYSVEIVLWCLGRYVYPRPDHNQFTCCRIKEAGQPLDKSALCDSLSAWFCDQPVFGTFPCSPVKPLSYGGAVTANPAAKTLDQAGMGGWIKYLDVSHGVLAVPVPMCYGSLDNAVRCAKGVMENILEIQG